MLNPQQYLRIEYPSGINRKYVLLLADYLVKRFGISVGSSLLDIGAGRGEYVYAFNALGLAANATTFPLEGNWASTTTQAYDVIFCKSVLEHIENTQRFLFNARQALKADGLAIFLVPDWNSQWRTFYDDSTHIKPFTLPGLRQALLLAGFKHVECQYFIQLPFTWRHHALSWIPYLVRLLPDSLKYWRGKQNVLVRFSKEKMLLCWARR